MNTNKIGLALLFLGVSFLGHAQLNEIGCSKIKSSQNNSVINNARLAGIEEVDNYDINYVKLDIKVDNLSTFVEGSATFKAKSLVANFSSFLLELVDPFEIDSILYLGAKQNYTHSNSLLTVNLQPIIQENEHFTVQIFYRGDPATGGFFSGISSGQSNTWGNNVTWTLSEPLNAKQWWPSKQVLEDKIDSADLFITVPNHLKAGSNGLLDNITAVDNSTDRYEWKSRNPIAYYLISFAVAEYDEYNVYAFEGTENELLVQNYLYNNSNVLPTFQSVIDQVPDMIELYSDLYGMYPFIDEKYGHTMAELGGGAMEHQTMSTMTDFSYNTTAHELAHQWFGNQVTCGTWQDIWVNEGFASYSEYVANEFLVSGAAASNWLSDAHNFAFQRPTGSIYVPIEAAEDEGTIFNYRMTYKKGGSIIHMIRKELNDDELFFDIMKEYQVQYKNKTALGVDFKGVVEQLSGTDFTTFFDQWYFGEGFPTHSFEWTYENDSLYVSSSQTTSSSVTPLFNLSIDVNLSFDEGDSLVRLSVTQNNQEFRMAIPKEVKNISIDPNNDLLLKVVEVTYNKPKEPEIILSASKELFEHIEVFPNPSNGSVLVQAKNSLSPIDVSVFDAKGRELPNLVSSINSNKISIKGLPVGVYVLHIQASNQIIKKKLIIQ